MLSTKKKTNKLLIATGNAHKVGEIKQILADYHIDWINLADFPGVREAEETGADYKANALIKARCYSEQTGCACIADDSGLEIDALDGAPGLFSNRFGGGLDQKGKIAMVLDLLKDVPEAKRTARFRCTAVAYGIEPEPIFAEAVCEGRIAFAPAGCGGFGYDPIFFVPDKNCCIAELPAAEKNLISHRGQAMRKLAEKIGLERKA